MKSKTIIAVIATVALAGGLYAWLEYDRGHKDTDSRKPVAELTASELLTAFQGDETAATARFVGTSEQVIQVSGTIRSMEPGDHGTVNVVLATDDDLSGVVCEFAEADVPVDWRSGGKATIKGICTGMLMDVVLVRCVAVP